jgi:glycosyltransferase involved in cell wall biosynthesis
MKSIKILVVSYSKELGGAEKSALKLVAALNKDSSKDVQFATLKQSDKDFYGSPSVTEIKLMRFFNSRKNSKFFMGRLLLPVYLLVDFFQARRLIQSRNFDVVISMGAGVGCVVYLVLLFSGISQIISERTTLDTKIYKPSLLSRFMRPWVYKHGVVCSVQTRGAQQYAQKFWKIKAFVTPNHFDLPNSSYIYRSNELPCIAVGRAAPEKGYSELLQIWSRVQDRIPNQLWIVADDSDEFLKNLISAYQCKRVELVKPTQDLLSLYKSCAIFISTSKVEGFPNAMAEAIIYGMPVVSTVSSSIVSIWSEKGICLVFDDRFVDSMAEKFFEVISDEKLLIRTSSNALLNRSEFLWSSVQKFWDEAIEHATLND